MIKIDVFEMCFSGTYKGGNEVVMWEVIQRETDMIKITEVY